jgi:hypothetical protein
MTIARLTVTASGFHLLAIMHHHHRQHSNYPPRRRSRSPDDRYSPPSRSRVETHRYEERHGDYDRYNDRPRYGGQPSRGGHAHHYDRWDEGGDMWRDEPRYDDRYRHEEVGLFPCRIIAQQQELIQTHLYHSCSDIDDQKDEKKV